jgi:hypothetical protein
MKTKIAFSRTAICSIFLVASSALPVTALAGAGHDHGDEKPSAGASASPRFYAISDTFELTGILNDKSIKLYLDDPDTNEPIKEAKIELEIDGQKLAVSINADGQYEAVLVKALSESEHAISATVTAGNKIDLLAGELDLQRVDALAKTDGKSSQAIDTKFKQAFNFTSAGIAGGALLLTLTAWMMLKRRAKKSSRVFK